jgi:hypothetical protein
MEGLFSKLAMLLSKLAILRGRLADLAGLRWAHVRGFDLVVPVAIALVVWTAQDQLAEQVGGLPFGLLWPAVTLAIVLGLRATSVGRRWGWPGSVLVVGIVASWVLYDIWFWDQTHHLYDLNVYLGSASRWLDGGQPYMTAPTSAWPSNARSDFFLYPPPLLPVFGALSRLPDGPVAVGWIAFLVACAYKSYSLLGMPRAWSLALLAFPPVVIGFESGNVASLTFLLFVASVRFGGSLIVDGLFKVQAGIPALWLVRQRRWRAILAGGAVVGAVVLVTLPLVGIDSWRAWWDGLGYRATSQTAIPSLYGYSYARLQAPYVYAGISAAMVAFALLFRGRPGLAALGLASIYASPALWPHGFLFALPAVLMLENGAIVWLVLGAGAYGSNMWHLFTAGWVAIVLARRLPSGRLHPLLGTDGPWPSPIEPAPEPVVEAPPGPRGV